MITSRLTKIAITAVAAAGFGLAAMAGTATASADPLDSVSAVCGGGDLSNIGGDLAGIVGGAGGGGGGIPNPDDAATFARIAAYGYCPNLAGAIPN